MQTEIWLQRNKLGLNDQLLPPAQVSLDPGTGAKIETHEFHIGLRMFSYF